MKKQTQIYLALTLIAVILIGLGCGISVFEISNYKMADYNTDTIAADLPPLELETQTLEAPLTGNEQFKLDIHTWWMLNGHELQYDNSLKDKVLVQISYPKNLYHFYLDHPTTANVNYYTLSAQSDDLAMFRLLLQTAKNGYIISDMPPIKLTLIMSEAQAKNFKLNEEQLKAEAAEQADYEQSELDNLHNQMQQQQEQYQSELTTVQEQYQNQLTDLQEQYDSQVTVMQEDYEAQLEQKDEQINQLQQQLNDIRNSLN